MIVLWGLKLGHAQWKLYMFFHFHCDRSDCSVRFDLVLLSHIYGILNICNSCDMFNRPNHGFAKYPESIATETATDRLLWPSRVTLLQWRACSERSICGGKGSLRWGKPWLFSTHLAHQSDPLKAPSYTALFGLSLTRGTYVHRLAIAAHALVPVTGKGSAADIDRCL